MSILKEYQQGCRIVLQLPRDKVDVIVNDWMKNSTCDIRIRKAKAKGMYAVEVEDPIYASRIVQYYRPGKVVFMEKKQ